MADQAVGNAIQRDVLCHEAHPVQCNREEPLHEFDQPALRQVAASVEVTQSLRIGMRHQQSVLARRCHRVEVSEEPRPFRHVRSQTPRKAAGNAPQAG